MSEMTRDEAFEVIRRLDIPVYRREALLAALSSCVFCRGLGYIINPDDLERVPCYCQKPPCACGEPWLKGFAYKNAQEQLERNGRVTVYAYNRGPAEVPVLVFPLPTEEGLDG